MKRREKEREKRDRISAVVAKSSNIGMIERLREISCNSCDAQIEAF